MSFLNIANAAEAVTPASTTSSIMQFLPMIVIFVLFWFLLIRPQQKKAKAHNAMISQLGKGDKVVTTGGIIGRIVKVEDTTIDLEVANNVIIQLQRSAISNKANTEIAK